MLTENIKTKIKEHALLESPNEVCGLISFNSTKFEPEVYKCKNKHLNKQIRFTIDPSDYLKVSLTGKILGYYHSHYKGGKFSEFDKLNAFQHKLLAYLYAVDEDNFYEYKPENINYPYFGRQFEYVKSDCFTLIRDYYKNELNIEITNFNRNIDWKRNNPSLIYENIGKENFILIHEGKNPPLDLLQKNDIILLKDLKDKFPSHLGIYLEDQLFLHQPVYQYSRIENYSNVYKRITFGIIRHNDLIKK